jgi:hypothetical protein
MTERIGRPIKLSADELIILGVIRQFAPYPVSNNQIIDQLSLNDIILTPKKVKKARHGLVRKHQINAGQ